MKKIPNFYYLEDKNIAYCAIPKNASSYFASTFSGKEFNWKTIKPEDINSETILFCHIRDPKERFIKGLVQVFKTHNFIKYFKLEQNYENPLFLKLFNDYHLIPISEWLEGYIHRMNFILLDHPTILANKLTNEFLEKHNIKDKFVEGSKANISSQQIQEAQDLIRKQLLTVKGKEIYETYIEPELKIDIEIYNKVISCI